MVEFAIITTEIVAILHHLVVVVVFSFNKRNSKTVKGIRLKLDQPHMQRHVNLIHRQYIIMGDIYVHYWLILMTIKLCHVCPPKRSIYMNYTFVKQQQTASGNKTC